ncbi:hypothetical protein D4S03_11980 [bacterium]|nr:MAG: hypothetical protein D4S03_11980 [bacterium]
MKLGKLPAIFDRRTLKLSLYLDVPKLPPLPRESDWFKKVSKFNMAGNTEYGDCTIAGAAHMKQTWTANAGRREIITSDKTVIKQYLNLTGGQDTGLNMLAVLNHWRKTGLFGDKIGAFVSVNPRKNTQMQHACWLFGGVYLGLQLPLSIKNQAIWDIPIGGPIGDGEPDSLGGHCVTCGVARSNEYVVSTWGEKQPMTVTFASCYADEGYAVLSLDWFTTEHKSPDGFAYKDLLSDLAKITQ